MEMTVLFTRYGKMDDGTEWANAQAFTDFTANSTEAGFQPAKIDIDTSGDFACSRKLIKALLDASAPVKIEAVFGAKSKKVNGQMQMVNILKDFKVISPVAGKPA